MTTSQCQSVIMFHRIDNIAGEQRLMEQMLQLQSEIRDKREADRIAKTSKSERYSKMFEPVTKSLDKLVAQPKLIELEPAEADVPTTDDLLGPKEEVPTDDLLGLPKEEEEVLEEMEEPGELYKQALRDIPPQLRDDGMLGLNVDTHQIGEYAYEVEGDVLVVVDHNESKEFEVHSLALWKLLIVMNPSKINLKLKNRKQYYPFVYEYADIAESLNLMASYRGPKTRAKYKLLNTIHGGKGFLFSIQPPSAVVIPSDDAGLMNELVKALAELRAGNSTMRNLVVPLAQEAKRKNLLPHSLLTPDEETWVFA